MDSNRQNFETYLKRNAHQLGGAIHVLWEGRDEKVWEKDPWFFLRLGETAATLGQSMFAHDVLGKGLKYFPEHVRLTQLFSLSLVTCGFLSAAMDLLTGLMKNGNFDSMRRLWASWAVSTRRCGWPKAAGPRITPTWRSHGSFTSGHSNAAGARTPESTLQASA
jgi:hypothetical protein